MVSDVTITGAAQDAQRTQRQSIGLAEDFDQFLTLLTTQLQNQDPLNPMDSTEFTNQLVQFSQVEQGINTNQKLDDLVALQLGSVSGVALGYVGMDVNYLSREFSFNGNDDVSINYALPQEAASARMFIYNEEGDVVYSADAPRTAGPHEISWSGENNGGGISQEGTYTVTIDAQDIEGNRIENSTVVSGRVRGIESQDGVIFLLVGDRAVPLGQVINASVPEESNDDTAQNDGNNDNSQQTGA